MKIIVLINLLFLFISCSNGTDPKDDGAPYEGEGFTQNISWENFNIPNTIKVDSIYRTSTRLKTKYKVIGDIYFIELDEKVVLDVMGVDELVDKPRWNYKEKYRLRFNTDNEYNHFDFDTEVKVGKEFRQDFIDGQYYSLYLLIDSIYIDSDTLYRSSLGADSLQYPFILPEKRWYVRGQEMYDSTLSAKTTDLNFLANYFSGQVASQIYYYPEQLYNGIIYIKSGQ